jgi:hypothetical protein
MKLVLDIWREEKFILKHHKIVKNVKNTLYKAINHYWNIPNNYAMIGALLDPRCKELWFASDHLKVYIQEQLRSIYKNYLDQKDDDYNNKNDNQIYDNLLLTSMFMQNTKESDEVTDCLAISHALWSGGKWMKKDFQYYQFLQKYIYVFLLYQHLFSNAGNLMIVKRTQLLNFTFKHLLFLKKNWNLAGGIFPKNNNVFSIIQD